ncbi:zinc-binding dehydrogenase [Mycobacterium sp.]|uniref:zinc-binding dehydrogenase n=1 Tax=Mycobacterium sp. TaxID=1785 RepID=UPI003F982CE5
MHDVEVLVTSPEVALDGVADWYRNGAAAELVAVEARNLALRPRSVDHVASSMLPVAGLAAWQALFRHGRLEPGQTLLVLGAGGGVGNLAVQMAHHAGAEVIGIGRAHDGAVAVTAGASTFIDLEDATLPNLDGTSLAFDTVGGEVATIVSSRLAPSARMVSIVDDHAVAAMGSHGTFFVVEPDREDLTKIATMVDKGSLRPTVGRCSMLSEGPELIGAKETGHVQGKVSIRMG